MRRYAWLWVVIVGLGPSIATAGKTPERLLVEADGLYRIGRYKGAIKAYEKAAVSERHRVAARLGIARSQVAMERYDDGIASAQRAVAAAAGRVERVAAQNYLGVAAATAARELAGGDMDREARLARREVLDQAEAAYLAAIESVGEPPATMWLNLADAQLQAGKWKDSKESLEKFLRLEPESPDAAPFTSFFECLEEAAIPLKNATGQTVEDEGLTPPERVRSPTPRILPGVLAGFGDAVFEGLIDVDGRLRCPRLIRNDGLTPEYLTDAAETLALWQFNPATRDGEPVRVIYLLTVSVKRN